MQDFFIIYILVFRQIYTKISNSNTKCKLNKIINFNFAIRKDFLITSCKYRITKI